MRAARNVALTAQVAAHGECSAVANLRACFIYQRRYDEACETLRTAQRIPVGQYQLDLLLYLATAQADRGNREVAADLLNQARGALRESDPGDTLRFELARCHLLHGATPGLDDVFARAADVCHDEVRFAVNCLRTCLHP